MKLTRDGALLWVLAGAALVGYLVSVGTAPTTWDYKQWLQFAAAVFAWAIGKLQTSPFPSNGEVARGVRDNGQRIAVLLLCVGLVGATSCATAGGPRHVATVSVVSAHAVLSAVQDTERALVCGQGEAPAPPACVAPDTHRRIAGDLVTAFELDGQIAGLVRALPAGATVPANVPELLGRLAAIVDRVVNLLPASTQKTALVARIGGAQ